MINSYILPTVMTECRSGICPHIHRPQGIPLDSRLKQVHHSYNSFSPKEITGTNEALKNQNDSKNLLLLLFIIPIF